mmetsp:Transcript_35775/g.57460  ORF Transcript_35775/g.57460 Transcript_35775/m.57460 type:complete len:208 (-) Transcript_35775:148-771(-)
MSELTQYLVQSVPQLRASGAPKDNALMVFLSLLKNNLVKGLTISLVGEGNRKSDSPPPPMIAFVKPFEMKKSKPPSPDRAPMMISRGNKVSTDSMLNMSWTVAPEKARSSSMRSPACAMLTIVFVTEVPMFAPMMIGIACLTAKTSAPTKPTTILVLVDEDCTKTVAKMPTMRPAMGLSEKVNRFPAPLLPSALKEPPIRSRPKRKK